MISLHAAKLKYAKALADREEIRKEWKATTDDDHHQKMREADREIERLMAGFAANPELRKYMWCWMVDFSGTTEPRWVEEGRQPSEAEMNASRTGDYTTLGKSLADWLGANGFVVTDSGGGAGGWDMGVPCSLEDGARLCDGAHEEFKSYIEAGVLSVSLKFWGWRFKNFGSEDQEAILKGN